MYINNISVGSRHNKPTFADKTALAVYFFNDGQYFDPYQISAVSIFRAANNFTPSTVIASDGQIQTTASSLVLVNFYNSNSRTSSTDFDPSNYTGAGETEIYRLGTGIYAVILDTENQPNSTFNLSGINQTITNNLEDAGDYIDVWTIRRTAGANLQTVINVFDIDYDKFFTATEPLMFRAATRLANRYIILGSKIDLKFTNEINIENSNIELPMLNIFKNSVILNPSIEIYKENVDRNLESRVTVSSFAQTSALCDVTSDNTIIFNWDTSKLSLHPKVVQGTFGSLTGSYVARVKFDILNQTLYSNYFGFIVS